MKLKLILLVAVVCVLSAAESRAQSFAITNARIVTVSGTTIEKGTVVVRNGLIDAVGANVRAPADARVIDGTGLTVYPGFIDALTNIGIQAQPTPQPQGRGQGGPAAQQSTQPTSHAC